MGKEMIAGFEVRTKELKDHWWEFDVYEPTGWDMDGNIVDYDPYLSAMIKWDGCSHLNFGDEEEKDGYLHLCGKSNWDQHVDLMRLLFIEASKRIKCFNKDIAGF